MNEGCKIKIWKTIFYIWGTLFVLTIISDVAMGNIDVFNTAILALGLIGLYGLSFNKAILTQMLWQVFSIVLVALIGITLGVVTISVLSNIKDIDSDMQLSTVNVWQLLPGIIYFIMFLIQMYGIYLYAYKRESLWKSHT